MKPVNNDLLIKQLEQAKTKNDYLKLKAMVLLKVDRIPARDVAKLLDIKVAKVFHLSFRLNTMGIEGLLGKKRGGRRNEHMTIEEEAALLEELRGDGEKGLIVIARTVKQLAEEKLGYAVSKDFAYDLLKRHGWRKVAPRPKHPKSSSEIQEDFKKKSPSWLPNNSKPSIKKTQDQQ